MLSPQASSSPADMWKTLTKDSLRGAGYTTADCILQVVVDMLKMKFSMICKSDEFDVRKSLLAFTHGPPDCIPPCIKRELNMLKVVLTIKDVDLSHPSDLDECVDILTVIGVAKRPQGEPGQSPGLPQIYILHTLAMWGPGENAFSDIADWVKGKQSAFHSTSALDAEAAACSKVFADCWCRQIYKSSRYA
jgi:hypothetical protein